VVAGGPEDRDAFGRRCFMMASLEISLCDYFGFAAYKRLTGNRPQPDWLTGGRLLLGHGIRQKKIGYEALTMRFYGIRIV
jgi:hypothetical protein